ncbi:hypothetical protein YC2023_083902 [Brassica napus]
MDRILSRFIFFLLYVFSSFFLSFFLSSFSDLHLFFPSTNLISSFLFGSARRGVFSVHPLFVFFRSSLVFSSPVVQGGVAEIDLEFESKS